MNDRNNLVLIGIGGAGTNTAKRISCCDRVIIESQNTPNQTADADRTILITSDIQDNGNRLFDSEISEINAAIKNYKIVVKPTDDIEACVKIIVDAYHQL